MARAGASEAERLRIPGRDTPDTLSNHYRDFARVMLKRWGRELAESEGQPNIIARLMEAPGGNGDSAGPTQVGASFTPLSERTDLIMKDIRAFREDLYVMLLAVAENYSLQDIQRKFGVSHTKAYSDQLEALGAFQMGMQFH